MVNKTIIQTDQAPQAIGTYSQAVKTGNAIYLSGQIPLDPSSMEVIQGDFSAQTIQVFENLKAIVEAAGASFDDVVKLTIFMTDLNNFTQVNEIMTNYFSPPYPARATVQVAALPKGVQIEIDGVVELSK